MHKILRNVQNRVVDFFNISQKIGRHAIETGPRGSEDAERRSVSYSYPNIGVLTKPKNINFLDLVESDIVTSLAKL